MGFTPPAPGSDGRHLCCAMPCRGNAAWDCARRAAEVGKPAAMVRVVDPLAAIVEVLVWATAGRDRPVDVMKDLPGLLAWFPSMTRLGPAPDNPDPCFKVVRLQVTTAELLLVAAWAGNDRPMEGEPTIPEQIAQHASGCEGCEALPGMGK